MSEVNGHQFVIIDKNALPDVYIKVLLAKSFLADDVAKNSSEACKLAGISRGAFYKYKDSVFFYEDKDKGFIFTFYLRLSDKPGVLSKVLKTLSSFNANVLTVNQNIPVNRVAVVTITFRLEQEKQDEEILLNAVAEIDGVVRAKRI